MKLAVYNPIRRFGYKILLRKVGGLNVAVGKIKFTFPTYVQIQEIDCAGTVYTLCIFTFYLFLCTQSAELFRK